MLEVNDLTKDFGMLRAVDHIGLRVERGEILGFLGPNGAGKSTTMRMITGFLPPTGGSVSVGGADIAAQPVAARRMLGYLPENAPVYPDMRVSDYLHFCGRVRGLRGEERRRRVAEVLAACALEEVGQQGISTLSKGFRQRVCFAQSILHDPPYLILDEPTDGLDPNQKHEVRSMIRRMAARKAIILSSHILDEVDALCTRAIIIARGRIVADDTPEGLRARAATHGAVTLQADPRDREALLQTLSALPGIKRVQPLDPPEPGLRVQVLPVAPNPALAGEVLAALSARQITIQALATERGRLEEVFRALTAPESTGAHAAAPGEGQPERNPQ